MPIDSLEAAGPRSGTGLSDPIDSSGHGRTEGVAAMCCLLTTLFLLGPRAAILVWWLLDTTRWELAFNAFWVAFVGFLILPWTTLTWVLVAPTGNATGFDWVWLGLGLLADVAGYIGGGYGNRERYPGYSYS